MTGDVLAGASPTPATSPTRRRWARLALAAAVAVGAVVAVVAVLGGGDDASAAEARLGALTVPIPDGWTSTTAGDRTMLVRDAGDETAEPPSGPRIVLERIPAGTDPAIALEAAGDVLDRAQRLLVVDEPHNTELDSVPAVSLALEDDELIQEIYFLPVAGDTYIVRFETPPLLVVDAARDFVDAGNGLRIRADAGG